MKLEPIIQSEVRQKEKQQNHLTQKKIEKEIIKMKQISKKKNNEN